MASEMLAFYMASAFASIAMIVFMVRWLDERFLQSEEAEHAGMVSLATGYFLLLLDGCVMTLLT